MRHERSGNKTSIEITNTPSDAVHVGMAAGQESSIESPGLVGRVNRALATVFKQEDADVVGFIKYVSGKSKDL